MLLLYSKTTNRSHSTNSAIPRARTAQMPTFVLDVSILQRAITVVVSSLQICGARSREIATSLVFAAFGPGHGWCKYRRMAERPRVVIALPDLAECASFAEWIVEEGFEPIRRPSVKAAADEMLARSFDLLIVDATFAFRDGLHTGGRGRNPLTPTVIIGDSTAAASDAQRRRAMFLNRPVDRAMLVCTVSMAILDGRPVRRSARKLVNRFSAMVNGVPSHIIDVSNEGMRLEIPLGRRTVPPPYFNVRVPLVGVAITVHRMWARSWAYQGQTRPEVLRCGGALSPRNRPSAVQGWQTFVDTIPKAGDTSSNMLQVG